MTKRTGLVHAVALCVVLAASGCGSDDDGDASGLGATPTPLPSAAGKENLFGSTAAGSGALTIKALPLVPVYFSASLGGTAIYLGADPGFKEADAGESAGGLFALPDGIIVSLAVLAIDPAVSLRFENGTLNAAGQSLLLGTTPGIHADLEWQLLVPEGAPFGTPHDVTLRLTTTSSGFTDSTEFTVTVETSTGSPPSEP